MGRIVFLIIVMILGFIAFYLGLKEMRENSLGENFFDIVSSLFLGIFQYTGIGAMLTGLLISLFSILALLFGWGK